MRPIQTATAPAISGVRVSGREQRDHEQAQERHRVEIVAGRACEGVHRPVEPAISDRRDNRVSRDRTGCSRRPTSAARCSLNQSRHGTTASGPSRARAPGRPHAGSAGTLPPARPGRGACRTASPRASAARRPEEQDGQAEPGSTPLEQPEHARDAPPAKAGKPGSGRGMTDCNRHQNQGAVTSSASDGREIHRGHVPVEHARMPRAGMRSRAASPGPAAATGGSRA